MSLPPVNEDEPSAPVWYVTYGPAMSRDEFDCYLSGGRSAGSRHVHPAAGDRTPPRADVEMVLPGRTWFAGHSPIWEGGTAFYDQNHPGRTPARAYLIRAGQLDDVRRHEGDQYQRTVHLGTRNGITAVTFTAPYGIRAVRHTRPSAGYLATMRTGIRESHGWDHLAISRYFDEVFPVATRSLVSVP